MQHQFHAFIWPDSYIIKVYDQQYSSIVYISSLQVAVMFPYLLLICFWCLPNCFFGQTVISVAPGVYSTKRQSDGLTLPATSGTFQPIGELTTKIHLTKPHSQLLVMKNHVVVECP